MSQGNKAFWQRNAGRYDRAVKQWSGAAYARVCRMIREKLTPEMYVLELACGSGQFSFPLAGSVELWDATDFSERMIEEARKRNHTTGGLRFRVQDAVSLAYEHDTFDAVVIVNALHVMPEPEKALREIRRVLKPGGLLFAPTYVHGGGRRVSLRTGLLRLAGCRVYHRWTARELKELLASEGFEAETVVLIPDTTAPICYIDAFSTK